ncbi:MAG: hypothetical protein J6X58_06500 [Bacteroidales bacterium]|nr:hypothetical protein [Bacteroidales bacterium]
MNKAIKNIAILSLALLFASSCGKGDPRKKGIDAGKAACECYKLDGLEAVEGCLKKIENDNQEFLNDTAYCNAMEEQLLKCVSDGVIDIVKPIKEVTK